MTDLDFLQQQLLWGVELWRLLVAALLLVVGLASRPFLRWLVRHTAVIRHTTEVPWVKDVIRLVPKPLSYVVQVGLWYGMGQLLLLPQEPVNVRQIVMNGLLIAVAVAAAGVVFKLIEVASEAAVRKAAKTETRLDDQLVPLIRTVLKVGICIIVGIAIIDKLGYSVTSLIASLSVGGLALALAAKDLIANLFGSVVVFTDQPFAVGDLVCISGIVGVIEEVGLRVTRVRQPDRSVASIPNQSFTTETVVNYSSRTQRRIRLKVGLSYDTTTDQITQYVASVRAMLDGIPAIDSSTVVVHLESLDESSIGIFVQAFTTGPQYSLLMETQEEVLMEIMRLIEQHNLSLAFPSRTLYLEPPQPFTAPR